jgi:hypothetical protein
MALDGAPGDAEPGDPFSQKARTSARISIS